MVKTTASRPGQGRGRKRTRKPGARTQEPPHPAGEGGMGMFRPEDLPADLKCADPGWQAALERYPRIHSIQVEEFPERGCRFVYLAHLFGTADRAEECVSAQEEFEGFLSEIGYEYISGGIYEDRWFEGIGIRVD